MANISYIRFLSAVEYFCKEHRQIRRFASDFPAQMPNFATKTEEYPILFVSPSDSIFNENTTTFNVSIYCFDIIQKDRANINTILSDTNLILSDLHRWIVDGEVDIFDVIGSPTSTPIDNSLLDYCAGWVMNITIDCPTYGVCEIPFIEIPSITTEVNNVVYNDLLTCDNLDECDTFISAIDNLQTQIDNIELIPGPTGPQGIQGPTGPAAIGVTPSWQQVINVGNSITSTLGPSTYTNTVSGLQMRIRKSDGSTTTTLFQDGLSINTSLSQATFNSSKLITGNGEYDYPTGISSPLATLADLIPGVTGATGPRGATGATGTSFLEPIFIDSYRGTRLKPIGATYNGFQVNGATNSNFGLSVVNTNTGNGAIAAISVSGTNSTGFGMGFQYHSSNYFVPYLRDNTALFSFQDLFIFTSKGKAIDFRTGTNFGDETSKLRINNNGQLNIGVTPSFGSTNYLLGRDTSGNVISVTQSVPNPIVSGYFTPEANTLTLVDSLGGEVVIQDEINIINTNLGDILTLIADRRLVRGVTYKIGDVDNLLYGYGNNGKGSIIYLLALEDNKLDEFGTGIFYTPKYTDFGIWQSTGSYNIDDRVIWGGYVWKNKNGNVGSANNDYELNEEWELISYDKDNYNIVYDKIKYDIDNDKIIYRNERNINEVSFNYDELKKIQNETGDYCPIKAFQWGKGFTYNQDKQRFEGIGNQRITNSYNRNINYLGISQDNVILNNQSYMYKIDVNSKTIMSNITLDNGSKITDIVAYGDLMFKYATLNNASLINKTDFYEECELSYFDLDNNSEFSTLSITKSTLTKYKLDNSSAIGSCTITNAYNYNMLYDNNATQGGTNNYDGTSYYYQANTTVKNTQISVVDRDQDGWFFLGDLPDNVNTQDIIGRINGNQLVDTSLSGYVPYVGATKNVDLGIYGLTATSLQFTGLTNSGRITWNDIDGTMDLTLKGGNVTLQVGQEQLVRVVNKTATNITLQESAYQAVRVTGAQGQRLKVDLAQATSDLLSAETIGLVTETIDNNQEGFVTISGLVRGINTTGSLQDETWADGDILYLSPTVAGQITNIKPVAPNHLIVIGYVVRAHITQGSIFVKVNNGYELDELHNVRITGTPSYGQVLVYGTSSVWENKDNILLETNDVRAWQLTGKNISVSAADGTPNGIFFKSDGTRMYFSGGTNDRIYQYDLSTAWDVSTAVFNNSLLVSTQDNGLSDLYLSPDGTRMYIVGTTNDRIYQYTLSTAWDVMSATFVNSLLVSAYATAPVGLYFKPDGTKCFIVDDTTDNVFGITLGTAWDITTGTQTETFSVTPFDTQVQAISFNNNGSMMYILGAASDDITQFSLSTPWNITTATFVNTSFIISNEATPGGLYYNETAGVAYITGSAVDIVYGMITTKSILYSDKTIEVNQGYFSRLETTGDVFINGAVRTNSSINAASSIISGGNLTVTGNATITTAVGIGNAITPSTQNFANGAHTTGLKTVNLGTGGLNNTTTVINLGSNIATTLNSEAIDNNFRGVVSVDKALHVEGIDINNSATGAVSFYDTFTEASNTALQSHTPDIGSGWTKSFAGTATNMQVFGGGGYVGAASAATNLGVIYTTNGTFSSADYEVSANVTSWTSGDDPLWVIFRYVDNSNFYGVRLSLTFNEFRLYKVVAGVATVLNGSINVTLTNTPQTFKVRVVGSAISLLLDSTLLGTWYDSSLTAAGKCGIGMGNINIGITADDMSTSWRLNDFKVQLYTQTDIEQVSYIRTGSLVLGATAATASAKLEVNSTTQGFLPPRMTNAQRTAIASPAIGLMVYCTDTTEGLYIYKSTGWTFII